MFSLKVQRPCLCAASLKVAEKKCHFLFERYVTTHWRDLWHNPWSALPHIFQSRHQNRSHARSRAVYGGPCVRGVTTLHPAALPLRCKQHCVCHIQFRESPFCDRPCSVPVSACELFCFLVGDEESCPFPFNKQTAVWINKLEGSGCGSERTVRSVSFSVCLSCEWAQGASEPNCISPAHNGLLHINTLVSLVQRQHHLSPRTFVFKWNWVKDDLLNSYELMCVCFTPSLCIFVMRNVTNDLLSLSETRSSEGKTVDTLWHWWLSEPSVSVVSKMTE